LNDDGTHPVHHALPPFARGYAQRGALAHPQHGPAAARKSLSHAPAAFTLAAPLSTSTHQAEAEPACDRNVASSFASDHADHPTGLWWLRPRARTIDGARHYSAPPASNLSSLEGQLRDLTTQIERLRLQPHAPDAARRQTQQSLDEIVAPLLRAVPLSAIESLESETRTLADRIDACRVSGVDPRILVPIAAGLDEVRAVLHQLNPYQSLAAFHTALEELTMRLSQARDTRHVSQQAQIDIVIAALRKVGVLVASKDTLTALCEEVRGLSAKLQRVALPGSAPEPHAPVRHSIEALPFSIETSLKDINRRLDALQKGSQPNGAQSTDADSVTPDKSAQDALEAVHITLSQLVAQLAASLRGAREARAGASHASLSGGYPDAPRHLIDFANEHHADLAHMPEPTSRSNIIAIRPLIFGALVIVAAAVAARVSIQMTDFPLPAITKVDALQSADLSQPKSKAAPAEPEVPDLVRSQGPETFSAMPERSLQQTASAPDESERTGVIGRPVPVAAGSREAAREPSLPLPDSLPAQLRAEAAKGKPAAEYEVGVRLVEGKSVPVDTEQGLRWLKRAAKSGIIPAHLWIGSLYEKGLGIEKNPMLARTHYMAAAEKGNAKAMHNLAVLYAEGIDGRRDYKTAARWFQRAAERGIADSQYNFAILLMRGIGVDQNHQEAFKWFALAALQGDREAARHRDEIGGRLEPSVLTAAKSAVRAFSPQIQPNEAVMVAAPPGGWDRPTGDTAGGRKPQSGIFARGAS
jgi:TPR repeat protein